MPDTLPETQIPSETQTPEISPEETSPGEPPKKIKVSVFNIIILIILLAILIIAGAYLFGNPSELGKCSSTDECGRYNVFYIQGQGYVCANDQVIGEGKIKTKLLMFKYAFKKAVKNEPAGCQCIEEQCELNESP